VPKFVIIRPDEFTVTIEEHDDVPAAKRAAGLDRVDHATLAPGVGMFVYEFGLLEDPAQQHFFSLDGDLYAGGAVIYRENPDGDLDDVPGVPPIVFLGRGAARAEAAIERGTLRRPETAVNGQVLWRWPPKADEPHFGSRGGSDG
jgi:hypothetical protein